MKSDFWGRGRGVTETENTHTHTHPHEHIYTSAGTHTHKQAAMPCKYPYNTHPEAKILPESKCHPRPRRARACGRLQARAVVVDMEEGVVNALLKVCRTLPVSVPAAASRYACCPV